MDHIPRLFESLASKIALKIYVPKRLFGVWLSLAGWQHSSAGAGGIPPPHLDKREKNKEVLQAVLSSSAKES